MENLRDTCPENGTETLSFLLSVAIFAGYILLSEGLSYAGINLALTGYFTPVIALAFLIFLLFFLFFDRKIKNIDYLDFLVLFYLIYTLFVNLIGYLNLHQVISASNLNYTFKFIALYLIFRPIDATRHKKLITFLFLSLSLIIVVKSIGNEFNFYYGTQKNVATASEYDYQGTALSYCVVYFTLLASRPTHLLSRYFYHLLCIASLAVIGSRSEFIVIFPTIFAYELLQSRIKSIFLVFVLFLGIVLIAVFFYFPHLLGDRISTITNLLNSEAKIDGSVNERIKFSNQALETVSQHPLLGKFSSYKPGEYAHNILSMWVDYGLIGILLFFTILIVAIIQSILSTLQRHDPLNSIEIPLLVFLAFILLLAKNYNYQLIPIILALIANLISKKTKYANP
ncbi:O-antigen ligase family protein [Alcaligenes nematophilus]|uniref:O-antigen ligase family protein n=1 Tax=Alcaligenes nematophilus TaxID=2994643 RepID=UPI0034E09E37